jgi:hypothetical protein
MPPTSTAEGSFPSRSPASSWPCRPALVYERRDALVDEAADIAYAASKTYAKGTTQYDLEMTRAENKLSESEERIKREAAKWGLAYDGVSDLSSVAGPFASIFYTPIGSDQRPFIVLCFKGTLLLFLLSLLLYSRHNAQLTHSPFSTEQERPPSSTPSGSSTRPSPRRAPEFGTVRSRQRRRSRVPNSPKTVLTAIILQ